MLGKVGLVLSVSLLCLCSVKSDVIVETESGKVRGVEVKSIIENEKFYSFMGIPYAEPLTNETRFMPPQPVQSWDDIYNATKERLHCPQFNLPIRPITTYGFCGKEDCLHLTIHTPKLPTEEKQDLPIIVFLYNEYFRSSHNGSKDFGPDFFMTEDVILITINHRLGSFGFLSYEDDLIPGNNALKDIILALQWIQRNIHNFGGNSAKVTLMGNDGGADLTDLLLHSPKAKGLFSGAILQSGTSWNSRLLNPKQKGRYRAKALGETLEIQHASSSLLLRELKRLPTQKITEAESQSLHADESRELGMLVLPFGPVIEHDHPDAVISKLPDAADVTVPVMIGYNTRESIEMCERYLRKPQYLTFADRDFNFILPLRVDYRFDLHSQALKDAIKEIKEFYFDEGYVKIGRPGEYLTYLGDIYSFYPIDYTVRKYANESKSPVYYYAFDYSGELNARKKHVLNKAVTIEGTWGASLGDELCYLFVCKEIKKEYKKALKDPNSEEIKVLKNMVRLWSNFAKTGNPTPPGEDFTWTPASKENKECLVISDELEVKSNINQERVNFWDDFLVRWGNRAQDGVLKDIKDEL